MKNFVYPFIDHDLSFCFVFQRQLYIRFTYIKRDIFLQKILQFLFSEKEKDGLTVPKSYNISVKEKVRNCNLMKNFVYPFIDHDLSFYFVFQRQLYIRFTDAERDIFFQEISKKGQILHLPS